MSLTKNEVRSFLFSLLGKRGRRLQILRAWQQSSLGWDENPKQRLRWFVSMLLYSPVTFEMTHQCIRLWGNDLAIPYLWLKGEEITFVCRLYLARETLFRKCDMAPTCFSLQGFVYDGPPGTLWDMAWRCEMLRDYVWDTLAMPKFGERVREMWVELIQFLLTNPTKEKTIPVFLVSLHYVLQRNGSIIDVCTKYN